MNSQQQLSEIGQENMLTFHPEPSGGKYVTYSEIQKYETQNPLSFRSSYNIPIHHEDCKATYLEWNNTIPKPPPCLQITPNNSLQWVINQNLSLCCFCLRFQIQFRLRKGTSLEIVKYRRNGNFFEEQGIKYRVENKVTSVSLKIYIVKDNKGKVWKQIQTPVSSYQTESLNHIKIKESTNGDIFVVLNGLQFMVSLNRVHLPGLLIALRAPSRTSIEGFCLEQIVENTSTQSEGCTQEKCLIF